MGRNLCAGSREDILLIHLSDDIRRFEDAPSFALTDGFSHIHLEVVDSTNSLLIETATIENDRLWLTASRQTGGKGRSGRSWVSAEGNLYASTVLIDPAPSVDVASLSFAFGLAVSDAIVALAPESQPKMKWPNDILLNGQKLAGILLEGKTLKDGSFALVAGCGVNCQIHPDDEKALFPPTSLNAEGFDISATELFKAIVPAFALRLRQWDRGHGLANILEDWRKRAHGLGTQIRARTPAKESHGIFEDIDPQGRLVLRTQNGVELISAGDVFFSV
jgi:BirA family biotin operon repressor/biotin-[acetyl-CoA-carboxylase] ligase